MKKANSAPTMKDVASEADVALSTVSKVVNGLPVREPYKTRVEEAIQKLNYHVNSYAKGLKSDKTGTIALLIPNLWNPFFASLAHHINRTLQDWNYRMLLCTTDSNTEMEQEYITMLQNNMVDGIIGLTYNPRLVVPEGIPFVSIDRSMGPGIPCVACDNFMGGQMAAEKLADLGCRNVAFLRTGSSLNNEPNKRRAGFENGCLARKLKYEMLILDDGEPLDRFDAFLAEHIDQGKLLFDGIFCVTDKIACYIIKVLNRMQVQVPKDVQIIGFDGIRQFGDSEYVCSTIVQPVQEIAQTCVDLLLQESASAKPLLMCLPVSYAYGGTTHEQLQQ
ncbi:MAG: LacI family DNA-binding transcriptional regulator [Acetatifactor sp.]|nr:LacI family DNA-binding transcriptional regulator [Acetatifactor sp.]